MYKIKYIFTKRFGNEKKVILFFKKFLMDCFILKRFNLIFINVCKFSLLLIILFFGVFLLYGKKFFFILGD